MFPVGDWQFWVATLVAAAAAWMLIKPFVKSKPAKSGCDGCETRSD